MTPRPLSRLCMLAPTVALLSCSSLQRPLPTTSPFIRGTIASHCLVECSLGYLIVVAPEDRPTFEYDSAWVKVHPETRVAHTDGRPAERNRLAAGSRVSVWTTPVVNESRPVQVVATVVVVEPSGDADRQPPRGAELVEAATAVVGFLQGKVGFERIRLADTVSLYLGRDEGGTRRVVAGGQLRDRSNWAVQSTGLRHRYSFVPPARTAELTTQVGRHINCLDHPLASTFPELARFPHVGTRLMYGSESCLQSWNLTLIFDPHTKPPTVIAALYDQYEW